MNPPEVLIQVVPLDESDMEETDRISRELRAELLRSDVTNVAVLEAEEIPEGVMGIATMVGWLGLTIGKALRLRAVVASAKELATRFNRTVEVTIDGDVLKMTGISSAAQEQLIAAFIARHTADV